VAGTASKTPASPQDDVDEMFGKAPVSVGEDDFAGVDDLLGTIVEDDSEGWVPSEPGEAIAGIVVKVGETRSDFANDGENPMVPTVTIQVRPTAEQKAEGKSGDKFRVIGYGAVLKRELQDADPQPGDMIGVKYFGEKPIKKGRFAGKPYKHFGVVVRKKS
jgi:hypothetical protein